MWNNSAFNHNQTFLPGGGLQAEIECGLLSPLHATCHCSSGSGHDPGPLLRHRPFGAAAQMCDMVTFKSSSDSDSLSLYTCMQVGACVPMCVCPCVRACARVRVRVHYPPVCAASHWLGMILSLKRALLASKRT